MKPMGLSFEGYRSCLEINRVVLAASRSNARYIRHEKYFERTITEIDLFSCYVYTIGIWYGIVENQ